MLRRPNPLRRSVRRWGSLALASIAISRTRVQRFTVVDNSDFFPTGLTALETLLMLASQGVLHAPHSKQRGLLWPFMSSCSSSSSLWHYFGVFAGSLFSPHIHQQGT